MAQVVQQKTGYPKVQGSHLTPPTILKLCFWAWFTYKTFLSKVWECDGEDGRAVISKFKIVGSTPTTLFEIFSFFHSHIHNV